MWGQSQAAASGSCAPSSKSRQGRQEEAGRPRWLHKPRQRLLHAQTFSFALCKSLATLTPGQPNNRTMSGRGKGKSGKKPVSRSSKAGESLDWGARFLAVRSVGRKGSAAQLPALMIPGSTAWGRSASSTSSAAP
jgi:hypothetical protein